jgi:AcrR family transcriptional regulator
VARRGLDRDALVELACAIADREGLAAVTLARVAAQAGVRPPSLYHHVEGRAGLLRAVALRGLEELGSALRAAAVGRSGADALHAAARAYRAYARAHPGRYAATTIAPGGGDDAHAAAAAEVLDVVRGVLRAWALEGDDAVHAVRTVRSALHGFVALEAGGGFALPTPLDASFEHLVATVAAGLDAGGDHPARRGSTSRA